LLDFSACLLWRNVHKLTAFAKKQQKKQAEKPKKKRNKNRKIENKRRLTLAPIWLPHWPACRCTISLILIYGF